jgi:hypothetical protein
VNTNEVCHFGIHHFIIEELECEVAVVARGIGISIYLHIVKVHFAFANACCQLVLLRLHRCHFLILLFTYEQWRLIP